MVARLVEGVGLDFPEIVHGGSPGYRPTEVSVNEIKPYTNQSLALLLDIIDTLNKDLCEKAGIKIREKIFCTLPPELPSPATKVNTVNNLDSLKIDLDIADSVEQEGVGNVSTKPSGINGCDVLGAYMSAANPNELKEMLGKMTDDSNAGLSIDTVQSKPSGWLKEQLDKLARDDFDGDYTNLWTLGCQAARLENPCAEMANMIQKNRPSFSRATPTELGGVMRPFGLHRGINNLSVGNPIQEVAHPNPPPSFTPDDEVTRIYPHNLDKLKIPNIRDHVGDVNISLSYPNHPLDPTLLERAMQEPLRRTELKDLEINLDAAQDAPAEESALMRAVSPTLAGGIRRGEAWVLTAHRSRQRDGVGELSEITAKQLEKRIGRGRIKPEFYCFVPDTKQWVANHAKLLRHSHDKFGAEVQLTDNSGCDLARGLTREVLQVDESPFQPRIQSLRETTKGTINVKTSSPEETDMLIAEFVRDRWGAISCAGVVGEDLSKHGSIPGHFQIETPDALKPFVGNHTNCVSVDDYGNIVDASGNVIVPAQGFQKGDNPTALAAQATTTKPQSEQTPQITIDDLKLDF
jgi:hypothetical protein